MTAAKVDVNTGEIKVGVLRLGIAIAALFITVTAATTPAILLIGRMQSHIGDSERHESAEKKKERIDERIELKVGSRLDILSLQVSELTKAVNKLNDEADAQRP